MNRNEFGPRELITYASLGFITAWGIITATDYNASIGWWIMSFAIIIALVNL